MLNNNDTKTLKVIVTQSSPWFNKETTREFDSLERAEQWARQCGIYDPFKITIKNTLGIVLYGFVSYEYSN